LNKYTVIGRHWLNSSFCERNLSTEKYSILAWSEREGIWYKRYIRWVLWGSINDFRVHLTEAVMIFIFTLTKDFIMVKLFTHFGLCISVWLNIGEC